MLPQCLRRSRRNDCTPVYSQAAAAAAAGGGGGKCAVQAALWWMVGGRAHGLLLAPRALAQLRSAAQAESPLQAGALGARAERREGLGRGSGLLLEGKGAGLLLRGRPRRGVGGAQLWHCQLLVANSQE